MRSMLRMTAAVTTAVAATAIATGSASAAPDKKAGALPVHVWCPGVTGTIYVDTSYVTSQIGAAPVWLQQPDGSTLKTALVSAADYQVFVVPTSPSPDDWAGDKGVFMFSKSLGNKTGYGPTLHCIHFANWGTDADPFYLEGPLDLAVVPSQS